jgi:hypothetical protein
MLAVHVVFGNVTGLLLVVMIPIFLDNHAFAFVVGRGRWHLGHDRTLPLDVAFGSHHCGVYGEVEWTRIQYTGPRSSRETTTEGKKCGVEARRRKSLLLGGDLFSQGRQVLQYILISS